MKEFLCNNSLLFCIGIYKKDAIYKPKIPENLPVFKDFKRSYFHDNSAKNQKLSAAKKQKKIMNL